MKKAIVLSVVLVCCMAATLTMAKDVVKVAFIGPMTGSNAAQGMGAKNSFDLAIRLANESGEFPYTLEVVALDDASDPATGASAAAKIVSDSKIVAAAGHWNSPVARATIPIFHENNTALIIWGAIGVDLTDKYGKMYPEITRVCPKLDAENKYLANFLTEKGYKTFSVIHDNSAYGADCQIFMDGSLKEEGATVLSTDAINVGEKDFMPILAKSLQLKPQAMYYGGVVTEAALLRLQMAKIGLRNVLFCGISGIADEKFNEVAGRAAEGAVIVKPGDVTEIAGWDDFVAAYDKQNYSEPMGAYGKYSYDAANIILAALKEVGPDKAKIVEAIRNINYKGLLGEYTFDSTGQTTLLDMGIMVSQDGKWVKWDDSKYATGQKKLVGLK